MIWLCEDDSALRRTHDQIKLEQRNLFLITAILQKLRPYISIATSECSLNREEVENLTLLQSY